MEVDSDMKRLMEIELEDIFGLKVKVGTNAEGTNTAPTARLSAGRGGGGGGPVNQPASCQHLPPAPPEGLLKPLS